MSDLSIDNANIRENLIDAYNSKVDERDAKEVPSWKKEQRSLFLQALLDEDRFKLVDIGAGTGTHAIYFRENGLDVTCIDLTPGNVSRCREKALEAYECDVLDLESLGLRFDAAFAMSSLLHVPSSQLPSALTAIRNSLNPGGLFYWGQYGGVQREGVYEDDEYDPKRFFSLMEDEKIQEAASDEFILVSFVPITFEENDPFHYQSLILRAKQRLMTQPNNSLERTGDAAPKSRVSGFTGSKAGWGLANGLDQSV